MPLSSPSRSWITHTRSHITAHTCCLIVWIYILLDLIHSILFFFLPRDFDSSDMDRLPTAHFGCPCFSFWQSGLEEPSHVNSGGRDSLWTSSGKPHSGTDTQATLPLMVSASLQNMLSLQACMKLSNKSRICFHTLLPMSFISLLLDVSSSYAACHHMVTIMILISVGPLIESIDLIYLIWSKCKSRMLLNHTQQSYWITVVIVSTFHYFVLNNSWYFVYSLLLIMFGVLICG